MISLQVKLKCIQMFLSIITHLPSDVAMPYIHYMAPKIAEYLYNASSSQPTTETERDLLLTSISCFELLISIAEENKRKLTLFCFFFFLRFFKELF